MMARSLTSLAFSFLVASAAALAEDWPGFRGPGGLGVSQERGVPTTWGPKQNILWKIPLPGPGSSSPIVSKDRVFLTCYSGYGFAKGQRDVKSLRRHLLCVERATGKVLWDKAVASKLPENDFTGFITQHGYASSTPVTDGKRIYVFFGRTGVVAFDWEGKQLWQTEVGDGLNSWGSGASPVLFKDLVIVNASIERSSLVALDKHTGKEVWRVKGIGDCWSTPALVEVPGGGHELVLNSSGTLLGLDPEKGTKLWECEGISTMTASSTPVSRKGVVYLMGRGDEGALVLAVRAGGRGDVTKTHIVWKQKGGLNHHSPVLVGDRLYLISGLATCLNADTGAVVYQQRVYGGGKQEYSSPVAVDGKLIYFSRYSGAYVLAAGDELKQLAHNDLGDKSGVSASPAVSGACLFIRSNTTLYCIGEKR